MSTAFTSAGSSISIGLAPATYDAAGFAAVSYSLIGEVVTVGDFGQEYTIVEHKPIAERRVVKRKGSFTEGELPLEMALADGGDAGQTLLKTASGTDDSYSFKVVLQNGDISYFTGQVTSFKTMVGGVDDITSISANIVIDNAIIEV